MVTFIPFKTAKSHFLPDSLLDVILQDLIDRDHPPEEEYIQKNVPYYFDFGGMAAMGMPTVKGKLSTGEEVEVPADQVETALLFIDAVRRTAPRSTKDGQPYYKLHGAWHCYVFTPEGMREARQVVADMVPEADTALRAFEADRRAQGLPGSRAEVVEAMQGKGFMALDPQAQS